MKARVLLADDHAIVRTGLRLLIEREPDFVVAGEATDGREAVDWLSREQADVVVMDVGMPVLSGVGLGNRFAR
jgi:YesN/AraC family two-component response regulator